MANHVLVAYATNAGSTAEVARVVGEEIERRGKAVEVRRIEEVGDLSGYDAVVVGAPMILGWHRQAVRFVQRHADALSRVPTAYFITALSLTQTGDSDINGTPIFVDPKTAKAPRNPERLSLFENYAAPRNYLAPVLRGAPQVRPVSAAFFGGKLDFSRLNLLHKLFVLVIIRAKPGDYRNWDAIRGWAQELPLG